MRLNLAASRADAPVRRVAEQARAAARRAHAPYSGFRVGAALLLSDGSVVIGCNVENASYPLGVCAERVALSRWRQTSRSPIVEVAIYTDTAAPTSPCGLCRDALVRWAPAARLALHCRSGSIESLPVERILPTRATVR